LRQVLTAKKDATLKIELSKNYEICRYQDEIYIVKKNQHKQKKYEIFWNNEPEILLPNGTKLNFKKVTGGGIALEKIKGKKLIIANRKGGESFKPNSKRPTKKLKQLLQESDLPPWEREEIPLIFVGNDLVFLPHFGIDMKWQTKPKEDGLKITWVR
ncbi:MAG: tRNA(Ile)-lysidine synthetase, partial [Gammaproteobacteria bacterium]|nr:tRNA(Ile)-lysidine synthetase [Gammaproteobacteria bacterium]